MAERAERGNSRSSRSRSRSARRRAQFQGGAATEDVKEAEDRREPREPVPMNASFKDITNPNQRMPVLVNSESIEERAQRLAADQDHNRRARKVLHQTGRSDRRSRSASMDSDREMEALDEQIQANEAVIKEYHEAQDEITDAATEGGLRDDHTR